MLLIKAQKYFQWVEYMTYFAPMGITPLEPTPTGMWSNRDWNTKHENNNSTLMICLHGSSSKCIQSKNWTESAFCFHGTILEQFQNGSNGSKTGPSALQDSPILNSFGNAPNKSRMSHMNRSRSCLVLYGMVLDPCKHTVGWNCSRQKFSHHGNSDY